MFYSVDLNKKQKQENSQSSKQEEEHVETDAREGQKWQVTETPDFDAMGLSDHLVSEYVGERLEREISDSMVLDLLLLAKCESPCRPYGLLCFAPNLATRSVRVRL